MPNDLIIRKQDGGQSGDLIDDCQIRVGKDGKSYELIAVLSVTPGNQLPDVPFKFPPFAYRGLIWDITVNTMNYEGRDEWQGPWTNNSRKPGPPGEGEDGTWTA